ncbi:hypothetical protein ABN253_00325 [Proteus genomosp. 6]|uniref:Uncharacterized protein n=1 Tax=Proteus genomosp. 6 TaxID=1311820 RepID=A0ABV1L5M9_9GAMM|nr:hypothetical protein [Proteus hauseri]QAV22367.1 hypothetical protein PH4a_03005 [Proteus hauseri]
MNTFSNKAYPTTAYPRHGASMQKRNFDEALAHAIAVIDGKAPNDTPSMQEQKLAMQLHCMNLEASKNHPPLPPHIQALRDAERKSSFSENIDVDYYGGNKRPGQYLGD